MQASTQDRRKHPREQGTLVEIENITYRVLRNYEQAIRGFRTNPGEHVTLIEAIRSSCNQRGAR